MKTCVYGVPWYKAISKHNTHGQQILSLDLIMYSSIIKAFISISAQLAHTFPSGWSHFYPLSLLSLLFFHPYDEIQVLICNRSAETALSFFLQTKNCVSKKNTWSYKARWVGAWKLTHSYPHTDRRCEGINNLLRAYIFHRWLGIYYKEQPLSSICFKEGKRTDCEKESD